MQIKNFYAQFKRNISRMRYCMTSINKPSYQALFIRVDEAIMWAKTK